MVQLFIGITDKDWFDTLAADPPDEVNFWQPSGRTLFRALKPGELFLIKLHAPHDAIVGGGVFLHASQRAPFAGLGCVRAQERRSKPA